MSYWEDRYIEYLGWRDGQLGGRAWAGDGGFGGGPPHYPQPYEAEQLQLQTAAKEVAANMTINVGPAFVMAGDATFTVSNGADAHFTYHVYSPEPTPQYPNKVWFIKVLIGPDTYAYLGQIIINDKRPELDPIIKLTSRSRVNHTAQSYKVAGWALRAIWQVARDGYKLPEGYTIQHDGRCGRCGRALTHPASLDTGLGPECADMLGVEWRERTQQPVKGSLFDFNTDRKL